MWDELARPIFRCLPPSLFALPRKAFLKLTVLLLCSPPNTLDPGHQQEARNEGHGKNGHNEKNQFEDQSTVSIPRS